MVRRRKLLDLRHHLHTPRVFLHAFLVRQHRLRSLACVAKLGSGERVRKRRDEPAWPRDAEQRRAREV